MANIANILGGIGAVASGVASGYKDPSAGIEIFLRQRQLEQQQVYNQMKIKSTLWAKGYEEIKDEAELKNIIKNSKHDPDANKGIFELNGSFYKYNPKLATGGIKNFDDVKKELDEKFPNLKGQWTPSAVKIGNAYYKYNPT